MRARVALATLAVGIAAIGTADARTAIPPSLICKPPAGADELPPTARHGLIDHMPQYPAVDLATVRERRRARSILDRLVASAERENWRSLVAAERAGYDTKVGPRAAGDRSAHFFHAERHQEPRRGSIFNAARPKALIYANVPGHPLILVGAMWSTRDGERGPTPAGPILRWHSHVVCKSGTKRGVKPPPNLICPRGSRLTQGASEMLHVWFLRDLRSAFAVSAPRPELCASELLPRDYCHR